MEYLKRNWVNAWQVAYILLATSWLFAPVVNNLVSDRTTSISQYMIPGMPYAWMFRACEFVAAVLLLLAVARIYSKNQKVSLPIILLTIVAFGVLVDLIVPTSCQIINGVCSQVIYGQTIFHNAATAVVSLTLLLLTIWDIRKNKRGPSYAFLDVQVVSALLLAGIQLGEFDAITITQFVYQGAAVLWTAWFVVAELHGEHRSYKLKRSRVNRLLAYLVALQGVAVIIAGTTLFDIFNGRYSQNQALVFVSHSVFVGIAFLYISRQLMRGERRAWQLLMVLLGIEIIKYSVLSPHALLLGMYIVAFAVVLACKDFFSRGLNRNAWKGSMRNILIISGLVTVLTIVAYLLDYVGAYSLTTDHEIIITTLVIGAAWSILWILFRPQKHAGQKAAYSEIEQAQAVLDTTSNSTEDFFKLWPIDKEYFWSKRGDGFVAYKIVGPIAYALADPIATNNVARRRLLDQFIVFCRENGWHACFLLVDEASLPMYKKAKLGSMRIGASAVVDIEQFVSSTARNKSWRWQRNKGRKMNYEYSLLEPPYSHSQIQDLREVSDEWLERGGHQEESFALGYFNTEYLQRCRIHLLKNEAGKVVAFTNEIPLFNNSTQTTVDLIRFTADAPHANNYLFYSLLHHLYEEDKFKLFDIGFVPMARMKGKKIDIARKLGANRFSAAGLERFKNEFAPNWRNDYIAYDGDVGDLALIGVYIEKAMAVDIKDLGN